VKLAGISKDENDGEQQPHQDHTHSSSDPPCNSAVVGESISPSKPEKSKTKGKSFRNLFGLLSFGGKSKNSSETPVEDDSDRLASVDNITLEKPHTNTNTEEADVTSTEGASSFSTESSNTATAGKLEIDPLSPKDTEASTITPSPVSSVETNNDIISSNEAGNNSANSSPQSAPRRPSMLKKLRSKSIHRVVTVRSAAVTTTSQQHETEDNHQSEQLKTESGEVEKKEYEETDESSTPPPPQSFSPMNSPYIHQGTIDSPLKTSLKTTAAFQLFSNVSHEEMNIENQKDKETSGPPPTKPEKKKQEQQQAVERRDSYEIVDSKGRKRSITAVSENAPLPPPPPEAPSHSLPVVVDSPDGRRISIKVLSPGAPIVPPPPPSSPAVTLLSPIHRPSIDRMTTEEQQAERSLPQAPPSTPVTGVPVSVIVSDVSPLLKRSLKPPPPPPSSPMVVRPMIPINLTIQEQQEEQEQEQHQEDGKQLSYHNMIPSEEEIQDAINEEMEQGEEFGGGGGGEEEPFVHLEEN
jgi:hypothetical protein